LQHKQTCVQSAIFHLGLSLAWPENLVITKNDPSELISMSQGIKHHATNQLNVAKEVAIRITDGNWNPWSPSQSMMVFDQ